MKNHCYRDLFPSKKVNMVVELKLDFHVDGVKSLLGSVFAKAADKMVDAFCQRANSLLR